MLVYGTRSCSRSYYVLEMHFVVLILLSFHARTENVHSIFLQNVRAKFAGLRFVVAGFCTLTPADTGDRLLRRLARGLPRGPSAENRRRRDSFEALRHVAPAAGCASTAAAAARGFAAPEAHGRVWQQRQQLWRCVALLSIRLQCHFPSVCAGCYEGCGLAHAAGLPPQRRALQSR